MTLRNRVSFADAVGIAALLAALGGLLAYQLLRTGDDARESALQSSLDGIRDALEGYAADHGWYPCSPHDFNREGDPETLVRQLTGFTDRTGRPSAQQSGDFCFGPYLRAFPAEPITGTRRVAIDLESERTTRSISQRIATSDARGGWFYEARSGTVLPNLGRTFPEYLTAL